MENKLKSSDIKKLIEASLARGGVKGGEVLQDILNVLESEKVFKYRQDDVIGLLSTPGRIMVVLSEDPTMTSRSLSEYLDLSETMIDKTLKSLIHEGLITKTKVGRQNIYKILPEETKKHPDIRHLKSVLSFLSGDEKPLLGVVEDEPF